MPSMWTVYFGVEDIAKSLEQVEKLGGTKHFDPIEVPGTGKLAWVSDSVGAVSYLLEAERATG